MISTYLHSCKVCDIEVCMHFFVNNTCDLAIALFTTCALHMYDIHVIVSVILLHFSPTGFYSFTYYICHAICTPFTLFPLSPSHSSLSLSFLLPSLSLPLSLSFLSGYIPHVPPGSMDGYTYHLRSSISVLFIFERRPSQDKQFSSSCRYWLNTLVRTVPSINHCIYALTGKSYNC